MLGVPQLFALLTMLIISLSGLPGELNPHLPPALQVHVRPPATNPGVKITSPVPGQRFAPGDTLTVNVKVDLSLNATDVLLGISGMDFPRTARLDLVNYQATAVITMTFSGLSTISAVAVDADGHEFPSTQVAISVSPLLAPVHIAFVERDFYIDPSVASEQLSLNGTYADKIQRDLTSSDTGTIYATSNPAVVTVDGFAQIKGTGIAVITAVNGRAKDFAIFVVENDDSPLLPQNLTPHFTIQQAGDRLDKSTGYALRNVVVTNSPKLPIPGPLCLILAELTNGVTLVN